MTTDKITPLVITFNEEANIDRCLAGLAWAKQIIVMDSGSTDATLAICAKYPQVRVVTRAFDSFAGQCNAGLAEVTTPWVLSCDADYIAESQWPQALASVPETAEIRGWRVPFTYCIHGKKIRSGLYPGRVCLYQREGAVYHNDGHGHKVSLSGEIREFPIPLLHDDRKPLKRWLASQLRYAEQEAEKLLASLPDQLSKQDRLRLTGWAAPIVMFFYCLVWRRGLLDGRAGWCYAAERTFAELLLALHITHRKLQKVGH